MECPSKLTSGTDVSLDYKKADGTYLQAVLTESVITCRAFIYQVTGSRLKMGHLLVSCFWVIRLGSRYYKRWLDYKSSECDMGRSQRAVGLLSSRGLLELLVPLSQIVKHLRSSPTQDSSSERNANKKDDAVTNHDSRELRTRSGQPVKSAPSGGCIWSKNHRQAVFSPVSYLPKSCIFKKGS